MGKETLIESFCKLQQKLHNVACRLLRNEMEAEDAVQDAFCNLWSDRSPNTSDEARYRLFAVLRNICLNKLKRRRHEVEIDECNIVVAARELDDIEYIKTLLIQALPPLQRQIFQMAVFDELEYDIIAERLDMTVDAVRMNMSRARKKLRERFNRI